jgi:hypothetical protein
MLTLALLLTLSAQPPVVCVGITGPQCDYTYQTIAQAEAEAPPNSMLMVGHGGVVVSLKFAVDEIHRQKRVMREMQKRFNEYERRRKVPRLVPL